MDFKPTIKDTVYGAAVGDAMGVPFNGMPRSMMNASGAISGDGRYKAIPGTWSSNIALMLATCDSIREKGHICLSDLKEKFDDMYVYNLYTCYGKNFGLSNTTKNALKIRRGLGGKDNVDNGALTRIAPLAYCDTFATLHHFDSLENAVRGVSRITHSNTIVTDICIEYVHLLHDIIVGHIENHTEYILSILPELDVLEADVPSTSFVGDTIFAALWSFIFTDSYEDCIMKAVNLGGDTNNIASVAGGLAGTYYGYNAIPEDWIRDLQDTITIDNCLFDSSMLGKEND